MTDQVDRTTLSIRRPAFSGVAWKLKAALAEAQAGLGGGPQ